jgi:hypothetical protein
MTNQKIRNLLILIIFAFSLVGVLKFLNLYEGHEGQEANKPQQSPPTQASGKKTKNTQSNIEITKEKV